MSATPPTDAGTLGLAAEVRRLSDTALRSQLDHLAQTPALRRRGASGYPRWRALLAEWGRRQGGGR